MNDNANPNNLESRELGEQNQCVHVFFMAEVQWCKVALCLPLMATKTIKSVYQFRKTKVISVLKRILWLNATPKHFLSAFDDNILVVATLAAPTALTL